MSRTYQDHYPEPERRRGQLMIPCRIEHHDATDERPASYSYDAVMVPDHGDDLTAEDIRVKRYADIRRHYYGDWTEQMGMQYDGTWEDHVAAVKAEFPKSQE